MRGMSTTPQTVQSIGGSARGITIAPPLTRTARPAAPPPHGVRHHSIQRWRHARSTPLPAYGAPFCAGAGRRAGRGSGPLWAPCNVESHRDTASTPHPGRATAGAGHTGSYDPLVILAVI